MIRINLARSLTLPAPHSRRAPASCWLGGLLLFLFGIGCGWWTYHLGHTMEGLLQEKASKTQQLVQLQKQWDELSKLEQQRQVLVVSLEKLKGKSQSIPNAAGLVETIGHSVRDLNIWLDRVQIESESVEIHGQSFLAHDVGRWVDRLETRLVLNEIPVVEILEHPQELIRTYSFVIQFSLQGKPLT